MTLSIPRPAGPGCRPGDATAGRHLQRGQSLTELALVLPVLLVLVVAALDFGRIYLGYINIQNEARIAANEAANNPLAWSLAVDPEVQERYRNKVIEDTAATNCALPTTGGGEPIVPDPVFHDQDGDGIDAGLGDRVTVRLTCRFAIATPFIAQLMGDHIDVAAESNFPVKAGVTAVLPPDGEGGGGPGGGGGVTAPPSAGFIANSSVIATSDSPGTIGVIGPDVVVDLRDASGGGFPDTWTWDFGDGETAHTQDTTHAYHCADPSCEFVVTFTASNTFGDSTAYMTITVIGETDVNFSASPQVIDKGQTVTFTDQSTPGGTNLHWDFGDGATADTTDPTISHRYTAVGAYTVTLTVSYPAPVGDVATVKTAFITVNPGYCPVPILKDIKFNVAQAPWTAAGFTGLVKKGVGAANGNFTIKSQSIAGGGGAVAICTSDVYVSNLGSVVTP